MNCYGKGVCKYVLFWEVVLFSEGPLSEVPLYFKKGWTPFPRFALILGSPENADPWDATVEAGLLLLLLL